MNWWRGYGHPVGLSDTQHATLSNTDFAVAQASRPCYQYTLGSTEGLRGMHVSKAPAMKRRTVAVVGASADRSKYSNKAIRAYLAHGWEVLPINPKGGTIEGLKVFSSVADIVGPVDRVTLYLPPALGLKSIPEIAAVKPSEFFVNPGAESPELVAAAEQIGLQPILACSIIEIGARPSQFTDD